MPSVRVGGSEKLAACFRRCDERSWWTEEAAEISSGLVCTVERELLIVRASNGGRVYESIVVGTDGSETAQRAVAEATHLAKALGDEIHLVAAYEPLRGARIVGAPEGATKEWDIKPDSAVQSVVEQAAAAVRLGGVEVNAHTVTGDPADAILEVAERENAGLIVVGNRGMHGMTRVLGSVPNKVSHRASCSVLIVSTDAAD
jgi:nucleotide-binding universal stress UspA family protein